jgi:predicted site-specific integrase-resolvase
VEIALTNHARFKLKVLEEHGYSFTEDEIKETVKHPAFTKHERFGRVSAHKNLNDLALRIIYQKNDSINVITVMVVRRGRYEG